MSRILPLCLAAAALLVGAPAASATHAQPPLDINKMTYQPIGHFKPGEAIPPDYGKSCETVKPLVKGKVFNPSGVWNAFDNTIYEYFCLPFRNQDDSSAADPEGNGGESAYGYCANPDPSDPLAQSGPEGAGTCPNHQMEYIQYYKETMLEVLKDFGPSFHEYDFEHSEADPEKGQSARNPAIVVPGADHPDEHVIIGSHYDQTTTGPASLWDSQEGHAEMIRVAKIMADYWKSTGTRPSATVKFMPTDGEEDGSLGSADYVANTVVPDQESHVRSYWNADPCAGGYPARKFGDPTNVVPINVQIGISDEPRVVAFNETAATIVEQVFEHLDDKIEHYADQPEVFVATSEGLPGVGGDIGKYVFISKDHPAIFSSDWTNFIAAGIPFFNPSPKVTGPGTGGDPSLFTLQSNSPDAVVGFHTPLDNLQTMSRYTGQDQATGNQYPEAYMKGMEMCSHMLAWGMLQPNGGGAQTANTAEPVAYYEALPNEAEKGKLVTFDASGSYQYSDVGSRAKVDPAKLQFKWEFGDGKIAFGTVVKHAYKSTGTFPSKLTITNRDTAQKDAMDVPIVVEAGTANQDDPPGQDVDNIAKAGSIVACKTDAGFTKASVSPEGKGLRFDVAPASTTSPATINVFQASAGKKSIKAKKVMTFANVTGPFSWNGKLKKGKLKKGSYYVTLVGKSQNNQLDIRAVGLDRTSKFKLRKPFQRNDSCELVSSFRLGSPAFGGKRKLDVGFSLTKPGKVTISLFRGKGKKPAKKVTREVTAANRLERLTIPAKKLKKGEYRVVLTAEAGGDTKTETLYVKVL